MSFSFIKNACVAVIMPVFPRLAAVRTSLASLRQQTRPPDLVILLDDRSNTEINILLEEIPDFRVEILKVDSPNLPAAINQAVDQWVDMDFFSFLQTGDFYAPTRIEKCLAAINSPKALRPPALAITALEIIGGRGTPLPPEDPRTQYFAKLWETGRTGVSMTDWLATGYFAGSLSNLFARRSHLVNFKLLENTTAFSYGMTILAGLQDLLTVIDEPLLQHYPIFPEQNPSEKSKADMLLMLLSIMKQLEDKLAVSPETRRNFATFIRVAWQNMSGLRADIFQQTLLRLASTLEPEQAQQALSETLRSHKSAAPPMYWDELTSDHLPDKIAYIEALQQSRQALQGALAEIRRLTAISNAAQSSGWIRLGAWLGERDARRIMEMEKTDNVVEKPNNGIPIRPITRP